MSKDLIEQDCDGNLDKRWVKRRNRNVTALLDRVRNGNRDEQPLVKLAQSIENEWGGIERFGQAWVENVKESHETHRGASKTLNSMRDMAKVFIGICSAGRGAVDLSELSDDDLNRLDVLETLVQILSEDSWVLRDVIGMVPTFDMAVLVAILQDNGYTVVGGSQVVDAETDSATEPAS